MKNTLLEAMLQSMEQTRRGDLSRSEQALEAVFADRQAFLREVQAQEHFSLKQAAALACVCYKEITWQYLGRAFSAAKQGDPSAESLAYQNAGRCLDRALGLFAHARPAQADLEKNIQVELGFYAAMLSAANGRLPEVREHLQECIQVQTSDGFVLNFQQAARDTLREIEALEHKDAARQALEILKDVLL